MTEQILNDDQEETLQDSNGSIKKLTKNQKRKLRNKKKKQERKSINENKIESTDENENEDLENIEIEYIPEKVEFENLDIKQYLKVFEKFSADSSSFLSHKHLYDHSEEEYKKKMLERKKPMEFEMKDDDEEEGEAKISKRKLKQLTRFSVSDLKQKVKHPELVEMHDVTSKDPVTLLLLKSTRNTVPVPRHWCYKRKYLQGKRGFEKPPFRLPEFIKRTGIMEMREALQEKEDAKSLKAKMKEKIRPKMGKIDIDYQKLHDAFFKWQTKPKMNIHGDLYYEGKEFETRLKEKKPGDLSTELRVALGMPTGNNSNKCPPPWLIAMQRYGPPPSYPNLKIAGLNAPIPDGCSFGYHAGGWGKPPVDEFGRPLYGDVFGTTQTNDNDLIIDTIDSVLWGEIESEEEEEEDDDEEEDIEAEEIKEVEETGLITPAEGLVTPSGIASIPAGLETPDIIELRKRKIEAEMDSSENPQLYQVLQEKKTDKIRKDIMGSTHVYEINSNTTLRKTKGSVDVALNPNELESLDSETIAAKYDETLKKESDSLQKEDLSDMVAEHAARQKPAVFAEEGSTETKEDERKREIDSIRTRNYAASITSARSLRSSDLYLID
ncbi:hypothetical protein RND71_043479 [Anisodus tanguticus]|uniref:PSP proline-rich domain-containing protein n=1 Tax=Anisodus tanguticus TaxID=243964 RepID=A0AAE1UMA4_9SOLA|nr:hypothetical protein RND71_043479 [Anisodus tanguticus]